MALIHISSRIPEHLKNEIEAIAKERTVPVSAIVMEALYSFVKTEKDVERVEAIVSSLLTRRLKNASPNSIRQSFKPFRTSRRTSRRRPSCST